MAHSNYTPTRLYIYARVLLASAKGRAIIISRFSRFSSLSRFWPSMLSLHTSSRPRHVLYPLRSPYRHEFCQGLNTRAAHSIRLQTKGCHKRKRRGVQVWALEGKLAKLKFATNQFLNYLNRQTWVTWVTWVIECSQSIASTRDRLNTWSRDRALQIL